MSRTKSKIKKSRKARSVSLVGVMVKSHWLLAFTFAVASYFGLVYIESILTVTTKTTYLLSLAIVNAKDAIPAFFLVIALISFMRQRKYNNTRKRLVSAAKKSDNLSDAFDKLDWREFELLVGQVFRDRGFSVVEGEGTKDGGVDLVLRKRGETYLVQCKHWKANVGVATVRELFGVMNMKQAQHAVVVCSGRFTKDAYAFASKAGVSLVCIDKLEHFLSKE